MKANELMIGDWVRPFGSHKGVYAKITSITPNRIDMVTTSKNLHHETAEYTYPIPLTPEILEKNGFKADAFTNLSPDYYYGDGGCSVCVNLKSTCDKPKSIWVENKKNRFSVTIEESRHGLEKKPLMLHELQHALRLCGIEKEIEL